MTYTLLYLDNHLFVVDKPPGLLAQADATGDPDLQSLGKEYLKERFDKPGNVFLGLVHRLDRPASGVMVLARTSKAAARLSEQFRARTPENGRAVDHLQKQDRHVRVVPAGTPGAKRAVLQWKSLADVGGRSLVEVRLETGRAHQIRVQLAHRGHPLVGDIRYGATQELDGRNLGLHAYALAVDHPTRRERMAWIAPPPATWGRAAIESVEHALRSGLAADLEALRPSPAA